MAASKTKGTAWTPEEDAILRKLYPTQGHDGVMKHITGRSATAIKSRAKHLSVKLTRKALAARRVKHIAEIRAAGLLNQVKKAEPVQIPDEYIQAADIFQVGYRVARDMGVIHEFA